MWHILGHLNGNAICEFLGAPPTRENVRSIRFHNGTVPSPRFFNTLKFATPPERRVSNCTGLLQISYHMAGREFRSCNHFDLPTLVALKLFHP